MTPLAYAGGVTSAADARQLVKLGADRICLEHLFSVAPDRCREIRDSVGVQAVIRALTLEVDETGAVQRYDYLTRKTDALDVGKLSEDEQGMFSELMVIDRKGDGGLEAYDERVLIPFAATPFQIIAFGGITSKQQVQRLLARPELSAVGVGNSLSYRELANRRLLNSADTHETRKTSHGAQSRGARQW